MTETLEVVEVGPRDGLQNEDQMLSTESKIELVHRLMDAGLRRIEVASFVHPRAVPQMADAEDVIAGIDRREGVSIAGLVLNRRGFERALAAGVDEVNFVVVATETFNQRNQRASVDESLAIWESIADDVSAAGMFSTVTIGASFGCPFEGEVPSGRVVELARRIVGAGVDEICLADTIGVGDPGDVARKLEGVAEVAAGVRLRCHFHNTRNTGLANAYAAIHAGVSALDSSIGGIGGCPFAPAATGNIPTEDLVYMLDRLGVATGAAPGDLAPVAKWIGELLDIQVPGMLSRAGMFPADEQAA
jgi:hydroxymethylglutaryl-CoA lyase